MKTFIKPAVFGICLITLITWASRADDKENENSTLKKRIETLESRLKTMEGRLAKLEGSRSSLFVPSPNNVPGAPPAASLLANPPAEKHGTIWKEGEVNGWPYYLIPVSSVDGQPRIEK